MKITFLLVNALAQGHLPPLLQEGEIIVDEHPCQAKQIVVLLTTWICLPPNCFQVDRCTISKRSDCYWEGQMQGGWSAFRNINRGRCVTTDGSSAAAQETTEEKTDWKQTKWALFDSSCWSVRYFLPHWWGSTVPQWHPLPHANGQRGVVTSISVDCAYVRSVSWCNECPSCLSSRY